MMIQGFREISKKLEIHFAGTLPLHKQIYAQSTVKFLCDDTQNYQILTA